jgi:hypothetical protein
MTDRMLPCPFCGGELYSCDYDGGKTRYLHAATGCILDRKFVQGEKQKADWNRRTPPPQALLMSGSSSHSLQKVANLCRTGASEMGSTLVSPTVALSHVGQRESGAALPLFSQSNGSDHDTASTLQGRWYSVDTTREAFAYAICDVLPGAVRDTGIRHCPGNVAHILLLSPSARKQREEKQDCPFHCTPPSLVECQYTLHANKGCVNLALAPQVTDNFTKCPACDDRGYFYCDCHPAHCICGVGEGIIDPSYEYFDPPPSSQPNLRGLIDEALTVLDIYADPTGYTDRYGDQVPADAERHEGLLAKDTAAKIRAALAAAEQSPSPQPKTEAD